MIKRSWLWVMTIVLLLISVPGLYDRWKTEFENNTYELSTPYQEIYNLTIDSPISMNKALSSLKQAGLNTVSLSPVTLDQWDKQDIVEIYGQEELEKMLKFSNIKDDDYQQKQDGFYITVPKNSTYIKQIKKSFDPIEVTINNQSLYFIPDEDGTLRHANMGYNKEAIKLVKKHDLNYILRVENVNETKDGVVTNSARNEHTMEQLINLKSEDAPNILFSGQEVIGYPDLQNAKTWANQLNEVGYQFYSIEFANQMGLPSIAKETNYDFIRLHSMRLGTESAEESVDRAVRAIKERNIRSIFFHFPNEEPVESLAAATGFLDAVTENMPGSFNAGSPEPFREVYTPLWIKAAVLLAGILFTYLAASIIENKKIRLAAPIFMFLLALASFAIHNLIVIKAFALIIAIITPIYAVISSSDGTTTIRNITFRYLRAIGISFAGIAIVTGLLNGNAFITGFELFRGVKLVYVIPILFLALYILFSKRFGFMNAKEVITVLRSPVKYWHIISLMIIGFVIFYYISRTGNAGSVSEIELLIRHKLEEYLYVRPRTKEFLIGFPLYILALYTMGVNKKWGKFLLILGVIGFLSIMNTFTHFHIPLHISLLRTAYSIVIGYILGIFLIYLVKICFRYITKTIHARWS
ncbi:hypothetical protein CFK37_08150 [Virgibacillus phasianinus]|uniref:Uncharacterized protein n=1 Tax=Virgibacillus phasianinus TaxID=2017483 RepID=A0A220U1W6_9BACI|nr:DUF5693 family protein [Virgibacillus phasianinus]ASK62138.1 hypothetical protein CFK37_08150 [Virgibacillus phasianinus]